jgi:hypothetical protein
MVERQDRAAGPRLRAAVTFSDRSRRQKGGQGKPAQRYDHARLNDLNLRVEPTAARLDFVPPRRPVMARSRVRGGSMLHDVRDVDLLATQSGARKQLVQQPSRATDKRPPEQIFPAAGAFSHNHDRRVGIALPGDRMRCPLPQAATPAPCHAAAKRGEPPCSAFLMSGQ